MGLGRRAITGTPLANARGAENSSNCMLKLNFFQKGVATPAASWALADLRVSGATLWNPLDRVPIATYSQGSWKYRGRYFPTVAVTGRGCLLFGITRDPTIVSDPIDHYYFIGPTLSANGVAIAKYIEQQDMWQGMVRPMWWNAMRILSVDAVSAVVDQSQVVLLNPWEAHPMHSGPHLLDGQPDGRRVERPSQPQRLQESQLQTSAALQTATPATHH
jgi:hypothetical protein